MGTRRARRSRAADEVVALCVPFNAKQHLFATTWKSRLKAASAPPGPDCLSSATSTSLRIQVRRLRSRARARRRPVGSEFMEAQACSGSHRARMAMWSTAHLFLTGLYQELGRVVRTVSLLQFISDPELREGI